jgi:hypothetical protein
VYGLDLAGYVQGLVAESYGFRKESLRSIKGREFLGAEHNNSSSSGGEKL